MNRKEGDYVKRYVDMIALLVKKPRTTRELCEFSGVHKQAITRWMIGFESEGMVRRELEPKLEGRRGPQRRVWHWVGASE
ncbi:MAG: hypothetical protein ABI433_17725 [Burkholderiaceae bacterium]